MAGSDFKDISARFKKTQEDKQVEEAPRDVEAALLESFMVRAKMVGVLLRDARLSANRTVEEVAAQLGVAPQQIEAWEYGDAVPTLPELEVVAHYLNVPVSHFWGTTTLTESQKARQKVQAEFITLRNRMIGALLLQAREEAGMSPQDLAAATGIPAETIRAYEFGEQAMPMHELTVLANGVRKNIGYFLEDTSSIGEWLAMQEDWRRFVDMPPEIREFVSNPLHVGFIEIAIMLSKMPVDRLRNVGASILDITR